MQAGSDASKLSTQIPVVRNQPGMLHLRNEEHGTMEGARERGSPLNDHIKDAIFLGKWPGSMTIQRMQFFWVNAQAQGSVAMPDKTSQVQSYPAIRSSASYVSATTNSSSYRHTQTQTQEKVQDVFENILHLHGVSCQRKQDSHHGTYFTVMS